GGQGGENSVRIYPNPAQDLISLFVDMPQPEGQAYIYTAMGMPVLTLKISDKYTSLNTANLANGVYFCRFTTNSGKHTTGKFVILR
ncbi:MAG TPA: T9SS type A sorting domain-containing protein, partial [Chitinophagales bacterium]|nr:T9SS type A sorting domain-containing protein [Chitinophagales bacterium]